MTLLHRTCILALTTAVAIPPPPPPAPPPIRPTHQPASRPGPAGTPNR